MAPTKKGGEKKGRSAIDIHERTHGMGLKKCAPWALKERHAEICHEGSGTPDIHKNTRLHKAAWAIGGRKDPHHVRVWLSRKHNEGKDSPNEPCMFVTYVPVTTFKTLQTVIVNEN